MMGYPQIDRGTIRETTRLGKTKTSWERSQTCIKLKSFCNAKETISKKNRQLTDEIFNFSGREQVNTPNL